MSDMVCPISNMNGPPLAHASGGDLKLRRFEAGENLGRRTLPQQAGRNATNRMSAMDSVMSLSIGHLRHVGLSTP
jgi:hypothetical protein